MTPKEFKLVALRECPTADQLALMDKPELAADYWYRNVAGNPYFNAQVENFVVLLINTRRKIKGHVHVSTGTLDTLLIHPREVFRPAIVGNASAIVLMHNHPSGEHQPSEADIKMTRDLIRAGQLLKIDVLDHVIVGNRVEDKYTSLRELGYFYQTP